MITVAFDLALGWDPHLTLVHGVEVLGLVGLGMLAFTWCGALVATVRSLTSGVHTAGSWQLDHPELAMVGWCLLLMAVCVPLALRRFSRTVAA